MSDYFGDSELEELMKKYDAVERPAKPTADFSEVPDQNNFSEVPDKKDFSEVPDKNNFSEVSDQKDFSEVSSKSEDDFREVPAESGNDFREVPSSPVTIDLTEKEPEIDLKGTGLVLAGGGGKGIYQVGMLKVLHEAGVLSDVVAISGVSIGAVNTVLYAMGVEKMEKVWDEIDSGTLFDFDEQQIAAGNTHFSRNEMNSLIDKYMDFSRISNDKRIMYIGTSRCADNFSELDPTYGCTAQYFKVNGASDEDINKYMLASTALPYIYSPVMINSARYIDGGINDNIPVKPLYDLGLRKFIVIELTPESKLDRSKFPGAEIIDILPSHDLGNLFTGTLNFEGKDKRFKKELGERDGKIYVKTKFEKDETVISIERHLLELEYRAMENELAHYEIQNKLESSVNANIDKFNSIANMYGNLWDD